MFLFMLKYGKYTDFFTASSEKDALKKAGKMVESDLTVDGFISALKKYGNGGNE